MKVSKYIFKAVTPVMALFQKQLRLPFKQGYDNLRSTCGESAASADSARSEKHFHRNQSAVCSSHNVPSDSKANVYLGIKGTNLVLAHICENRCSIIPREIMTCKGQIIDVVGQMLPCFWDKSGNEERFVDSSKIDAGYLSRVIMSIQKYGTLSTPLPDNIVVHHKGPLYLNTVESIMAVTEERHDDIHTEQSQKSHAEEKVINTPNELLDFLKEVQKKNKALGKSKM